MERQYRAGYVAGQSGEAIGVAGSRCHCEERSDAAIPIQVRSSRGACRVASLLAMKAGWLIWHPSNIHPIALGYVASVRDHDHPRHAETVADHAEAWREERLGQWH
jgi:hypothetical protein